MTRKHERKPVLLNAEMLNYCNYYLITIAIDLFEKWLPFHPRSPDGEGANIDRRLVSYHGKCRRIQSRIEFVYLFIYMYGTRSFL